MKKKYIKIFIPIIIIIFGLGISIYLFSSKPKIKRSKKTKNYIPAVYVMHAKPIYKQVVIHANGTVAASRKINLKSRVSGRVVNVSDEFIPGGFFKKDSIILNLDTKDFQIALKIQNSILKQAKAELAIEMGMQEVAREALKKIQITSKKKFKNTDLALRKPHLLKVESDIEKAQAAIEKAKLDLKRATIRAPFNCFVLDRFVELGSQVSMQETLATIIDTDKFWIETTISLNDLSWIDVPKKQNEKASNVNIYSKDKNIKQGKIIRLFGQINELTHMAKILIEIKDPLGLNTLTLKSDKKNISLLLGSYVSIDILGKTLNKVFEIPRKAVKNFNEIWVARNDKLLIQKIKPIWKNKNFVYVKQGLKTGDAIILSDLSAPINGMNLRIFKK